MNNLGEPAEEQQDPRTLARFRRIPASPPDYVPPPEPAPWDIPSEKEGA